jgi:hypothetical protein
MKAAIPAPSKTEDHDELMEDALEKALKATTPERPGCPWDEVEEEHERREPGFWVSEGD